MEIINDPCLATAHALTADSRKNRLGSIVHTTINEFVAKTTASAQPRDPWGLPPAFVTEEVMNTMVNSDSDLMSNLKQFFKRITECDSLANMPKIFAEGLQPTACELRSSPKTIPDFPREFQAFSWTNMEYASLGLAMCTSLLFGCNVASTLVEKAQHIVPARETEEYQIMAARAREAVATIVGSGPYMCTEGEEEDDPGGSSTNDYMWLHNAVPFVVVLESTFATMQQKEYLESILRYVADVKGIKMAEGVHDQWRHFRQSTTPSCSNDETLQPENHAPSATTC